jgi:ABC-2 type transport system permease protein
MIALSRREPSHATFLILMLLSNTLFIGIVVHRVGHYLYGQAWAIDHGTSSSRRRRAFGLVDRVTNVALFFMPRTLRQLILKDVKTFLRDPAQWSQCLLFFGLLALYILNIPRLGLDAIGPYWHNLVSMLNLSATCLTLSTFTSRFIYPQLSLEGRRMWIVGLMPMRRSTILWGKFLFAALGSLLISGTLIVLSDLMVGIDRFVMLVHCVVVVCVCSGLNGLAVGLGAIYPNLRTDNPSKIVSSFGGTFNLVCSIAFITACLAPISIALHFNAVGELTGSSFLAAVSVAVGLVVTFTVVATFVPMGFGARALRKMEF